MFQGYGSDWILPGYGSDLREKTGFGSDQKTAPDPAKHPDPADYGSATQKWKTTECFKFIWQNVVIFTEPYQAIYFSFIFKFLLTNL